MAEGARVGLGVVWQVEPKPDSRGASTNIPTSLSPSNKHARLFPLNREYDNHIPKVYKLVVLILKSSGSDFIS